MKRIAVLLLLLSPLLAHGEMNLITLKHRTAESLIPLLQPVLDEGVRVSGSGATLIVNCPPQRLAEVNTLVGQLDTPLRSLMISVMQGGDGGGSTLHGDVSGSLEQPRVRVYGNTRDARETVSQRLRVIEGEWATISAGESVPLVNSTTTLSRYGTSTQRTVQYRDVQSGFEVRPRVNGEHVTLEVRPFRARRAEGGGGLIEQQEIHTTVSGRVGEWLEIGGIDEQSQQEGLGTVYATQGGRNTTHKVRLKVEQLPN